jgi:signal transduction histidine kinase
MLVTAAFAIAPLIWFSSRVLRPVHELMARARQLARADAGFQRLESSGAIVELKEFADSFNESLDRVHALTQELEATNDQLAHELRTPLARIRGNVETILSRADDPASRESAARTVVEIDRAASLIQAILSIRAGDARSMKLQNELLSLGDLVEETCELYSAAAEAKGLELVTDVAPSEIQVEGDRQRLQQALCNLLDNALAYTPQGGKIEVKLEKDQPDAIIRVRDTGPGLTNSDADRIWRRFMRGSAASASTPGIGLGLSLVKAVINAHRGEVGAHNRPEGGAEFWIRLPCGTAPLTKV